MSGNNFTAPPGFPALPPLPPLNNPNVGSGTAAADSPNLASAGNAHVETLADEFFDSRSHDGSDVIDDFLQEEGAPDTTEASPLARRSLFDSDQPGAAHIAGGDKDEGAASSANFANFPSKIPTVKNRFANQDSTLNDEGYDSEGNLPYFADEEQDDIEKKVWSSTLKKNVDFAFLRWNLSNDYNFEMNDNDIADQLRLVYRFMRFQRNNKWWWALFLWGYEVSMVNSYVSYKRYCELKGVPVQWSHHDWNEAIGYAHLDPDEDWPTKKSPPETPTSSAASASKKRAPKIDSKALSPTRGRMKVRLDTNVNHMPVVPRGPPRANVCQLHRWADKEFNPSTDDKTGRKKNTKPAGARTGVMRCTVCNVNLCIPCWEIFHTKERIRYHIPGILGANK
jgi:hypothetical protein